MKLNKFATYLVPVCLVAALSFSIASLANDPKAASASPSMAGHSAGSMELHRIMAKSHKMPMPMSGNVDKDFAMMMTMHHQQAIAMVDVLVQRGQSPELKALAVKMKSAQQAEIKQMAKFAGPMDHGKMKMDRGTMRMDDSMKMDHSKMAGAEFARLDQNKDGKISKGEVSSKDPLSPHFNMLDTNRDGSLSQMEFAKKSGM